MLHDNWPMHLKRPWCWEKLKVGGEGDDRGWDGWMASPTQWTRVWVNSRSWWWTGRPGVLQTMGMQRVEHDRATELNWTWVVEDTVPSLLLLLFRLSLVFDSIFITLPSSFIFITHLISTNMDYWFTHQIFIMGLPLLLLLFILVANIT